MPGSNCHLDMAVVDVLTGCVARAGSATTVTPLGWLKDNGSPISAGTVPALPLPLFVAFAGLVAAAGARLLRDRRSAA